MSLAEAADFAEQWAKNHRGMVLVSEALRSLGSMELATNERRAALDVAVKAHEAKKAEVAAAEVDLAHLRDQHAAALDAHSAKLGQLDDESEARAAATVATAQKRSEELVVAARDEAERIQAAHAETMAAMTKELEVARADLASVRNAIAASESEHADLVPKIEAMRAAARGILA